MTVEVRDKRQLERVVSALRRISGVRDIERVNPNLHISRNPSTSPYPNPRASRSTGRIGHHSEYSLAYLRDECPCASCTGAHGTEPQKSSYTAPSNDPFPMYKPTLKMLNVEQVGAYAMRIDWSDGHSTGIYSFDYLRRICPCPECQSQTALA